MKFKALKTFTHDELGKIKQGQEVEATQVQATTPLMLGYFEPVEVEADKKTQRKAK